MTDLWDSEAAEYLDDEGAEWYDGGEDIDFGDSDLFGEAKSPAQKRLEARMGARRRALEIQKRAARSRTPARPMTTTAAIKNTRTALKREHLTNQVRADAVGGAVGGLRVRTLGLERTASFEAVGDTLKTEFNKTFGDDLGDDVTGVLNAVIDYLPLVFLKSDVKGFRNPPVMAGLAGGALVLTGLIIRALRNNGDVDVDLRGSEPAAPRSGQPTTK
jgi:hypothetical protein